MISVIGTPVIIVTLIGVISGVVLSVADKYMSVPTDERVDDIVEILPGVNCGACGFAGCEEYASKLVWEGVATNLCTPGGDDTSAEISEILGLPVLDVVEKVAMVRCSGSSEYSAHIMDYGGKPTCKDNNLYFEGRHQCSYACLGFGDCLDVCEYGAITIIDNIAVIDRELCTGCAMCVEACPNDLIVLKETTSEIFVGCNSTNRGAFVRRVCEIGCIGCNMCERACQHDAIIKRDNLAIIDQAKCTNCGDCVTACPTKVIKDYRKVKV